jgi:hypothetical protein
VRYLPWLCSTGNIPTLVGLLAGAKCEFRFWRSKRQPGGLPRLGIAATIAGNRFGEPEEGEKER